MDEIAVWYAAPVLAAFAGAAALAAGQIVARIAIGANWLPDRPNHRSSHDRITPRSGGAAIFAAWLAGAAVVAAFAFDAEIVRQGGLLAGLLAIVFMIGLADDLFSLPVVLKLVGQIGAAMLFVAVFGALETAPAPFVGDIALGRAGAPVTIFWIIAFMNAFNFMDGVNGIAASCAAFVLFAIAIAAAFFSAGLWMAAAGLGAVALVSFLSFNFPKGRLFMGDNGSQAIGYLIAVAAVGAANATGGGLSALFVPVAMAPFLVDVAFTLVHRMIRRRNVFRAHREHVYQLLLRLGLSHAGVTAVYLALTAFSTATAIAMLRLAPENQWIAPVFLFSAYCAPAALVFVKAENAGLLADELPPSRSEPEAAQPCALSGNDEAIAAGISHAAE